MKFGLMLPLLSGDAERVRSFAARAEELGFDGLFAADHMFPIGRPDRASMEAFVTLSAVGVRHPGLQIGTLVARVGMREPGMLAKMAASLDDMTAGRFVLGLGTGDASNLPEHEVFGIPWGAGLDERRALLAETVQAVKSLFDGEGWQGGQHTPEIPGPLLPAPSRAGGPPVWIGGNSDELVSIATKFADGWNAWQLDPTEFSRRAEMLGDGVEATWAGVAVVGRDDAEVVELSAARRAKGLSEAWEGTGEQLGVFAGELADVGASWCIFACASGDERANLIAEAVLA